MSKENEFQSSLDNFIAWMGKDGILSRWERQQKIDGVSKERRKLNKKIRETEAINETLEELA
jgi:cell division protein FtsB